MSSKHFLTLHDLPAEDVLGIVRRAAELKKDPSTVDSQPRKTLGLLFEKSFHPHSCCFRSRDGTNGWQYFVSD